VQAKTESQFQTLKFDWVIVRLGGEIGIKGDWTRRAYERQLIDNIRKSLKHYQIFYEKIVHKYGRIYVKTEKAKETVNVLGKVFGISSLSPALSTTSQFEHIMSKSLELADKRLQKGGSFAVRCHRVGNHPYRSTEVNREVGQKILTAFANRNVRVDLKKPDTLIGIEVRDEDAFIFSDVVKGAGGMPLGTQPKVVCLLSGGIDSPVACWLMMKRGCPIVPVYFDNSPFTDENTKERALAVAKKLFEWTIGFPHKIYIVPHGQNLSVFQEKCSRRLTCILCKRMMYRIAEQIAEKEKAQGIVTGESIGEQASQTLQNLYVLNDAARKYPVFRPLLGFDKTETEALAKKINTFETSIRRVKGCTAAPKKPATKAKIEEVRKEEESLDIERMVKSSVMNSNVVWLS
jgi:thiamine biosynthesis protein ThiI